MTRGDRPHSQLVEIVEEAIELDTICFCGLLDAFLKAHGAPIAAWQVVPREDIGCAWVSTPGCIDRHVPSELNRGWMYALSKAL